MDQHSLGNQLTEPTYKEIMSATRLSFQSFRITTMNGPLSWGGGDRGREPGRIGGGRGTGGGREKGGKREFKDGVMRE